MFLWFIMIWTLKNRNKSKTAIFRGLERKCVFGHGCIWRAHSKANSLSKLAEVYLSVVTLCPPGTGRRRETDSVVIHKPDWRLSEEAFSFFILWFCRKTNCETEDLKGITCLWQWCRRISVQSGNNFLLSGCSLLLRALVGLGRLKMNFENKIMCGSERKYGFSGFRGKSQSFWSQTLSLNRPQVSWKVVSGCPPGTRDAGISCSVVIHRPDEGVLE